MASLSGAALALVGVRAKPRGITLDDCLEGAEAVAEKGTNRVVTIPDVFPKPKPIVVACSKCGARREITETLVVVVSTGGKLLCQRCCEGGEDVFVT